MTVTVIDRPLLFGILKMANMCLTFVHMYILNDTH